MIQDILGRKLCGCPRAFGDWVSPLVTNLRTLNAFFFLFFLVDLYEINHSPGSISEDSPVSQGFDRPQRCKHNRFSVCVFVCVGVVCY